MGNDRERRRPLSQAAVLIVVILASSTTSFRGLNTACVAEAQSPPFQLK
jgi:hypothetical protein